MFEGTDGYVASAATEVQVPAQVRLSSATMMPPLLAGIPGEAVLIVRVGTTQSVNSGTPAYLEANEVDSGGISYSVNPLTRNMSFLLQGEGNTDVKTFTFIVGTQQPPQGGTIKTTVFLGVPGIAGGAPGNLDADLRVPPSTVSFTNPTPTPIAGGGSRVFNKSILLIT